MSSAIYRSSTQVQADEVAYVHNYAKICPTLFISLGGTGAEIALRVRRHILKHAWGSAHNPVHIDNLAEFPMAQFIYYDMDSSSDYRLKDDPAQFSDNEKLTSKLDIDKYLRTDDELNKYPHIAEWLPLSFKKLCELGINRFRLPAVRAFPRLYFFDKYQHLKHMIQDKINYLLAGVSNRAEVERLGLEMEPANLRVVVIASTAGCTGSGSFIDMGYLAKYLAKQAVSGSPKVDVCLMLPSGYGDSGHGKSRSEANTYASLMELETCMGHGDQFIKGWSSGEILDLPRTPYDDVFLFDAANLAQKTAEAADLFDMVANILFEGLIPAGYAEYSSRIKAFREEHKQYKYYSYYPPVDQAKYGSMKMAYSKAYSAFGQSDIELQLEDLSDGNAYEANRVNQLIGPLAEMDEPERRLLFQNCIEMAMPWVDADPNVFLTVHSYQYTCIIGVNNATTFEQKFGDEFSSVIPSRTVITPARIRFEESAVPDKLTCYVELSGLPLTSLRQLPNWRASYEKESKKIPVHIHKDRSLFVHPLASNAGTLDRLAEHFKLYIQGIMLGVLKVRRDVAPARLLYCLKEKEYEYSIGDERIVRLDGLKNEHIEQYVRKQVAESLDYVKTPAQHAGLVALYDFYSEYVYPPAILRNDGYDIDVKSFANMMCIILGEEARKSLSEVADIETSELFARLKDYLDFWTDEIEGSETDVYENEVGKSHMAKRILKSEFFQTGWLEQHIDIIHKSLRSLPEFPIYVAVNGQQAGPFSMSALHQMARSGQLTKDSLVWMEGMASWAAASTVPGIASVFGAFPPYCEVPPVD
ncbi:MAG: tubulin-like doman-containing protein [Desulfobacterales bacterium]